VSSIRHVSWDPTLKATVPLVDGRRITALELQWEFFEAAQKYALDRGLSTVGDEVGADVMRRWEDVLTGLETDPDWWPTRWTGWRRSVSWTAPPSGTVCAPAMPSCGSSTCSTTTSVRRRACRRASGWSASSPTTTRSTERRPNRH
jgi:hypothetical protein